jgi:hypothetical protein
MAFFANVSMSRNLGKKSVFQLSMEAIAFYCGKALI